MYGEVLSSSRLVLRRLSTFILTTAAQPIAFSVVENIAAPNFPHIEATSYAPASLVSFIRASATPNDDVVILVSSYYVTLFLVIGILFLSV